MAGGEGPMAMGKGHEPDRMRALHGEVRDECRLREELLGTPITDDMPDLFGFTISASVNSGFKCSFFKSTRRRPYLS